jgi:PAS domain S-box-containing protein
MKLKHFSLHKRFAVIVFTLIILACVFFITALNQIIKVKEYNKLVEELTVISQADRTIDSIQNVMFSILPKDFNFYKTGNSKVVNDLKNYNTGLLYGINQITNNFFLSQNSKIKLESFKINQQLKKYDDVLDRYTNLLYQRGFDGYGVNGQINMLVENLIENCKKENLNNLILKINVLAKLKDEYLAEREPSLINKFKIENEEAKALAILSAKNEKLDLLSKLQRFEELVLDLNEFDKTIGITANDGLLGQMNSSKEQFILNAGELKMIVNKEMSKDAFLGYVWLSLVFVLLILAIVGLNRYLYQFFHIPLGIMKNFISELVAGKLPEPLKFKHTDEISEMADYLNNVVDGLKTKAGFATEIGKGKLDSRYQPLSEDDILGNALIEMEKSLQKADFEDQKYKSEEKKRIWTNEGIAKFSEILRLHNNNIQTLADETIQNLVKYLNAAQGGLFLFNDEQKDNVHLELMASFAYDRKKYIKQTVKLGEGLVGTVALEKERIYLTEIPKDYMTVSSGLGEAPPRSILIVPLKLEDEILGIVELASFSLFGQHEIEFIEKVGQTIASTITNVKMNARTAKLLEQSQHQAEEMAEQEEEMRQNMEELRTTQEDFSRRETEISSFLTAIQNSAMVLIFDNESKIIDVNDLFLELLNSKREDIIGRQHREFSALGRSTEEYNRFWEAIRNGSTRSLIESIRLPDGKEIILKQTFSPVTNDKGMLIRVLCISNDITEIKMNEKLLEEKTNELTKLRMDVEQMDLSIDSSFVRCEYSVEGRIINVNDNYCRITGHSRNELIGKINTIYLKEEDKVQFEKIWNEVIKNKPYTGSIKRTKPTGEEIWLMSSFTPVNDNDGNIIKIFFLGQDITERRLKYQLLEEANKEIERLKKEKNK